MVGGKGNSRGEGAILYGQSQRSVGTCNNLLPVLLVSATSLGLLVRPSLLYKIFSLGGGFLKDRVFRRRIMTVKELKHAIVDEVTATDYDLRSRAYGNFQTRFQQSNDVNGGHLPDVQKISL